MTINSRTVKRVLSEGEVQYTRIYTSQAVRQEDYRYFNIRDEFVTYVFSNKDLLSINGSEYNSASISYDGDCWRVTLETTQAIP